MLKGGLRPALVFSDAIMPGGISGQELLEQAVTLFPSVKVLLTSGYSEDFVSVDGRIAPTFKLLRKPYRMAELAGAISTVRHADLGGHAPRRREAGLKEHAS